MRYRKYARLRQLQEAPLVILKAAAHAQALASQQMDFAAAVADFQIAPRLKIFHYLVYAIAARAQLKA